MFSVDQIGTVMSVRHRGPPTAASYEAGAFAAEVRLGSYYLRTDDENRTYQLIRHDGWSTELPVVDDVVRFELHVPAIPSRPVARRSDSMSHRAPGPVHGPAPPPLTETRGNWLAGENCTFLVTNGEHVPRLNTLAGGPTLVELTPALLTDGPWCPNALTTNRFDADLLRIRKVRVTLRVQSALASLRGPAGALFLKGGTASAGEHFVPDLEVQFDITPRNLNLGR